MCQLSGKNLKLASALHKLHIVDDQLGTGSNSSHSDGASSPMGQTLSTTTTRFMMSETGRANAYGQTGRRMDDRDEGMQAFNVKYVESGERWRMGRRVHSSAVRHLRPGLSSFCGAGRRSS